MYTYVSYVCRIFSTKSVQNVNLFGVAFKFALFLLFFYSLLIELHFLLHLTLEKRKNTIKFGLQQFTCITGAVKSKTNSEKSDLENARYASKQDAD